MNCFQFSPELLVSRPNIGLARLTLRKRGLARAQARDCKDSTNSQPCSLKIATIPGNCEQLLQPIGRDQPQGGPGVSLVVSWDPRFLRKTTRKSASKPATVSLTDGSNFFHTDHYKVQSGLCLRSSFDASSPAHHFLESDFPVGT